MGKRDGDYVSWSDFFLWREDVCKSWHRSIVVTMVPTAPSTAEFYRDKWTVWATTLMARMPESTDPHLSGIWPNSRYSSVPAMLVALIIDLDRKLLELEEERRTTQAF